MPLGTEQSDRSIIQGDTAPLYAYAFNTDESPITQVDVTSVLFTIRKPDATTVTAAGLVDDSGTGFYNYTDTTQLGIYVWKAQFTFVTGEKRTLVDEFSVYDPLLIPQVTWAGEISDEVWMRIEDCFDSQEGGPWLRDMTLASFDKTKVAKFIPEGLLTVNAIPPITNLGLDSFVTKTPALDPAVLALNPAAMEPDADRIIIVQATLLSVIRHLMRGYVEQPNPTGANVVWQDRRDYQQRWQAIYQIELDYFNRMAGLWKRNFLQYGRGSLLVHSKAGRLYGPGYNRAWGAGRGGWRS